MDQPFARNERERLLRLARQALLDTPSAADFDRIVAAAAELCQAPLVSIAAFDSDQVWLKAGRGLPEGVAIPTGAIPPLLQQSRAALFVEDVAADTRFLADPMLHIGGSMRAFAALPLTDPEIGVLGCLFLADVAPRSWPAPQREMLSLLAGATADKLALRRRALTATDIESGLIESMGKAAGDGILLVAPNGDWLAKNPEFLQSWGISDDSGQIRSSERALGEVESKVEDGENFAARVRRCHENPHIVIRDEVRLKDGRTLQRITAPVQFGSGLPGARLWITRDITPARRTEAALRESETRLRAMIDGTPDCVMLIGADGAVLHLNRAGLDMLELEPGEEIPNLFEFIAEHVRPDFIDLHRQVLQGNPGTLEHLVVSRGGARRPVLTRSVPVRDDAGGVYAHLSFTRDLTHDKAAESALRSREEQLLMITRNVPAYIAQYDAQCICQFANDPYAELFGARVLDILGKPVSEILGPAIFPGINDYIQRVLQGETVTYERVQPQPERRTYLEVSLVPDFGPAGDVRSFYVMATDITRHKKAALALSASESRYMLVAEGAADGIWDGNPITQALYVSPRLIAILGYPTEFSIPDADYWLGLVHPDDRKDYSAAVAAHLKRETDHLEVEFRIRHCDGSWRWIFLRGLAVWDECGVAQRMAGSLNDVTDRKLTEARVQFLAHHDALTGLPNRVLLMDRLNHAIAAARRHGGCLAVIFLDLDRFKNVNDTLGHLTGDQMLRDVAARLQSCLREDDTVARQGGDEFIVLLENLEDVAEADRVAQKIISIFVTPFNTAGQELYLGTSMGISIYPHDGHDAETLLRHADTAMYSAKDCGRNDFRFYAREMNTVVQQRMELERHLRTAVEREELKLVYQPLVDFSTGCIVGAEALLRWNHKDLGAVSPARFIPIAESTGLIQPIGAWVLAEACRQARHWRDLGYMGLRVAVNVSAPQLLRGNLKSVLAQILSAPGVDARLLTLELTESVIIENADEAAATLRDIAQTGIQLAIDDFGTGYSSLSYLRRFPFHKLKIDRSFVQDVTTDRNDAAIVAAIIAMSHSLGLRTVAEGVETAGQLAFLRGQGCDEAQGYFLGVPMAPADFLALLASKAQ
ncbi:MAG: EAL domain-containing protein [Rhodocyclaceae bacterium]|nr:EAL domain-containing protein [Rhodocyclaceae bacterium]